MQTAALLLLAAVAVSVRAQDFARADQVPPPTGGIIAFEFGRAEYYGYSPSRGMIFLRYGSTEGIGGNPDIDYVFIDPASGQTVEEIPVNINLFTLPIDYSDEVAWTEAEERNAQMADAAQREIARIWDVDDSPYTDTLWGTGGAVRCINPERLAEGSYDGIFRFYVYHEPTGWMKPIYESGEPAYAPEAVAFTRSRLTGGGTMLMLEFFRSPIMEFDTGNEIHLVLSPEQTAQYFNEVGFAWYGSGQYDPALTAFQTALSCFADYAKSAYNAACTAALLRNVDLALHFLGELDRIRDERIDDYGAAAARSLGAVDRDTDFNLIRADPAFVAGLKKLRQ